MIVYSTTQFAIIYLDHSDAKSNPISGLDFPRLKSDESDAKDPISEIIAVQSIGLHDQVLHEEMLQSTTAVLQSAAINCNTFYQPYE